MKIQRNIKKQKILRESSKVFAEVGYRNAKITEITSRSGIATGTIYLYFKNKEEILNELFVEYWQIVYSQINNSYNNRKFSSNEKIINSAVNIVKKAIKFPEVAQLVLEEFIFWNDPKNKKLKQIIDETKELLANIFKEGIQSGEFKLLIIPEYAASFIIGGIWHLLEYHLNNPNQYSEAILNQQTKILVNNMFSK